uniref:Dynein light chain Tctex-type family member 5 n=1 Tax=Callorhinchus milii TaxID=7868 RepID=A0A4W3JD17_CALMI
FSIHDCLWDIAVRNWLPRSPTNIQSIHFTVCSVKRFGTSVSTVSYMDDPGHHDDIHRHAQQMENTYQLHPTKRFPVSSVKHIVQEVLLSYLQEERYEPELCRQMTKTISEVIKARVKDLLIPRYKIIVVIHIGQVKEQSLQVGSRCLWDPINDSCTSFSFSNSSLFAVGSVYAIYFE